GSVAFLIEACPFALPLVQRAIESAAVPDPGRDAVQIKRCANAFRAALELEIGRLQAPGALDTTPGVTAERRLASARTELLEACDGFFAREAIAASLTPDERREILRGMVLTRAIDNRLKQFFVSGEIRYKGSPFQGKGFGSRGKEGIYAAGIRLRRGAAYRDAEHGWQGDVVGPIIRDAGVALAMRPEPATVRMILTPQRGKAGPPIP